MVNKSRPLRPARRASVHRSPRRAQRGLTLIEVLVTIAIMAGGMVGISAGLAAAERISNVNQNQAQLQVSMRQFTDWVRSSSAASCTSAPNGCTSLPYLNCGPKATYQADVGLATTGGELTPSGGETLTISQLYFSTGATRASSVGTTQVPPIATCAGSCNPPPGAGCVGDWGTQELMLTVASGGETVSRTVWKSNAW